MTSNAIGWNLEDELKEIERVLKPGACAIHLLRNFNPDAENPFHELLISSEWAYSYIRVDEIKGWRYKYFKILD